MKLLSIFISTFLLFSNAYSYENKNEIKFLTERALNCLLEKRYEAAVTCYSNAILLEPERDDLYAGRAAAYGELGNAVAALNDLDTAIRLNPNEGRYFCVRATANEDLGRKKEALNDLIKGAKLDDPMCQGKLRLMGIAWN